MSLYVHIITQSCDDHALSVEGALGVLAARVAHVVAAAAPEDQSSRGARNLPARHFGLG